MADYKLGLTPFTMVDLIDEPFASNTTEVLGFTLAGTPINSAFETILWEWTNMSQTGFYQLWAFWDLNVRLQLPPPYVYIRSLGQDGNEYTYHTYRCKMGKPEGRVSGPLYQGRDCTLTFYHCELFLP